MSLNIISARSAPIAFACLALFPGISTPASADYVSFPGAEWSPRKPRSRRSVSSI